jgi:uncharacterized RDD family membrane protein YckC
MEFAMTPVRVPEGEVVAEYAGFWQRVLARIIDSFVLGIASLPLFAIFGIKLSIKKHFFSFDDDLAQNEIWFSFTDIIIDWLYFSILESSKLQATVGKLALGLQVVDDEGYRMSFGLATARYVCKIVSTLTFGIGYLMVVWTQKKQALHDKIASTLVIRTR